MLKPKQKIIFQNIVPNFEKYRNASNGRPFLSYTFGMSSYQIYAYPEKGSLFESKRKEEVYI